MNPFPKRPRTRPQPARAPQAGLQLDLFAAEPQELRAPPTQHLVAVPPAETFVLTPPPPPLPAGMRRVLLGDQTVDYALLRSKRKSIGFLINETGLRVTAPRWVGLPEIERALQEKRRWILNKLFEQRNRRDRSMHPLTEWRDGGVMPFMGRNLTLKVDADAATKKGAVRLDDETDQLHVSLPPGAGEQQLKDRVLGWLQREAQQLFGERLPIYAERLGVQYRSFGLSSARTQWGSCTADGVIRLNWRLMHFALPIIDYVVAHELSHLCQMNHSPDFWATVESIYPDFRDARKLLRSVPQDSLPAF